MGFPSIDLSSIQETDVRHAYYLLFEHMKEDFVTKRDLEIMLGSATAPPPDFKVKYTPTYVIGDIMNLIYQALAGGLKGAKEALISGLESALGG
jgi:hypothetical protein